MNPPVITITRNVAANVDQVGTFLPIPQLGFLAVNAFLLRSREPVLIDAGIVNLREATLDAVGELIDPADIRWIYLTHADADHVGCLDDVLNLAPNAKLVTTFIGFAKLGLSRNIPPDRVHLLNSGQELNVGDRRLLELNPPAYDAPETTMLWDASSSTLFSSDFGGAVLPVTELNPTTLLSAHLPPAHQSAERLRTSVLAARTAPPFASPDQNSVRTHAVGGLTIPTRDGSWRFRDGWGVIHRAWAG